MAAQFLDPLSLGESGRAIAEEKKSVVCVFDVGLSLGSEIGWYLTHLI